MQRKIWRLQKREQRQTNTDNTANITTPVTIAVALQTADNHIDPPLPTTPGPKIPNVDSETPIFGAQHLLRSAGISTRQAPRIVKELTLEHALIKELNELSLKKSAGFCQATTLDQQGA